MEVDDEASRRPAPERARRIGGSTRKGQDLGAFALLRPMFTRLKQLKLPALSAGLRGTRLMTV
jgi:hypothetical protein